MRKIVLPFGLLVALAVPSKAQDWVGGHVLGDFYNVVDNWAPAGVPTGFSRVSNGGTATIQVPQTQTGTLRVGDKDGPGSGPQASTGIGTLIINADLTLNGWFNVARGRGTQGTVIMNNGTVDHNGGEFRIGGEAGITGGNGDNNAPTQAYFEQNGGFYDGTGRNTVWGEGQNSAGASTITVNLNSGDMTVRELRVGANNNFVNITQGAGHTLEVQEYFTLRGDNNNSDDTFTSNGGTLRVRQDLRVGENNGGGAATMTFNANSQLITDYDNNGGNVTVAGNQGGSTAGLYFNNASWVHRPTGGGGNLNIGTNGGSNGHLEINDSYVDFGGNVSVGGQAGAVGSITINGPTSYYTFSNSAFGRNGAATFTQNDGRVLHSSTGWFNIADQNGQGATYHMNGGSLRSNGTLYVGGRGNGWLHGDGGDVSARSIRVGHSGSGVGTLTMDGATVATDNDLMVGDNGNSNGTVFLNTGTLDVGATLHVGRDGHGTLEMAPGTRVEATNLRVANGNNSASVFTQPDNTLVKVTSETGVSPNEGGLVSGGVYNFDGGTLMTNRLRIRNTDNPLSTTGRSFNWGNGTLRPFELTTAEEGGGNFANYYDVLTGIGTPIPAGGSNFPFVRYGDRLNINMHNNENLVTGNGLLQDSTLLLGNLYQLSGVTRFNQVRLDTGGDLDLAATNDTLDALTAGVDFLRAFGSSRFKSYGSLVLVDGGNGGSTIVGGQEFANFTFAGDIQAREYDPGVSGPFTNAQSLPFDNWYLQYTANDIIFHYHLHGQLPEPNTVAYLGVGIFMITMSRRIRREQQARKR